MQGSETCTPWFKCGLQSKIVWTAESCGSKTEQWSSPLKSLLISILALQPYFLNLDKEIGKINQLISNLSLKQMQKFFIICHKTKSIINASLVRALFYFFYLFYFISICIFLTRRKATEALIHRVGNYPDLLPEIPRYCCPLVI